MELTADCLTPGPSADANDNGLVELLLIAEHGAIGGLREFVCLDLICALVAANCLLGNFDSRINEDPVELLPPESDIDSEFEIVDEMIEKVG